MASIYSKRGYLYAHVKDGKKWKGVATTYKVGDEENARRFTAELQRLLDEKPTPEKMVPRGRPRGWIYFVQGEPGSPIKIGYTSQPIEKRIREMQTGNADRLRALLVIPEGSTAHWLERRLHQSFAFCRIRGEWFRPDPQLLGFIAAEVEAPSGSDAELKDRIRFALRELAA